MENKPEPASFKEAFFYWLKLGFISFGGPAGQIAIMHQDLVEKRRWISEQRYLHALNYCMLLPGPEAQQLAIYIGWLMHKTWGGIIAGTLFVLPSFLILVALGWIYLVFGEIPTVAGILYGIKPAVTAIVLFAAYRIGSRVLKNWLLAAISALAFLAIFAFNTPFPLIVLSAALLGAIGGKFVPQKFAVGGGHGVNHKHFGAAIIDDDTPIPDHARFSWLKLFSILSIGIVLCLAAIGSLWFYFGWDNPLTQMGLFFTKAALLTFGGAYAVLPYVYQGAVEHYHWLTPQQMMDALALGETTPGPLVMVITFVGFVAGWTKELFGAENLFLAGFIAAFVVTYFTFLPSFIFILAGAPMIESTHGNLKFTAPLTGITAAVVGVILNLAVFFAYHTFWTQGLSGRFDVVAALIGVFALLALFRYKTNAIKVIVISALMGAFVSHFRIISTLGAFL